MPKVLTVRPNYDLATSYTFVWLERVVRRARVMGYEVIDLASEAATPENFFAIMDAEKPDVVILGVHGEVDVLAAQWDRPLLEACQNDGVLAGSMAYYGACLSGQKLAWSTKDKGAQVIIAYTLEFMWHVNTTFSPERDPRARPFGDVFIEPALAMLDGLPPRQIYERVMRKYDEVYSQVARGEDPETAMMLSALDNDRRGLIIYGEESIIKAGISVAPLALIGIGAALYLGMKIWKSRTG